MLIETIIAIAALCNQSSGAHYYDVAKDQKKCQIEYINCVRYRDKSKDDPSLLSSGPKESAALVNCVTK